MKRMKMRVFALVSVMVIAMASLAGCGDLVLESMTVDEIVATAEAYDIDVIVEDEDVTPDVTEDEVEDEVIEDEVIETKEPKVEKTEEPKTEKTKEPKVEKTEEPKTEKTEEPKAEPTPETAQPTPEPTPEPVHEHSWKEHTASTQTWIPNIVVVDDYETQTVEVGAIYTLD